MATRAPPAYQTLLLMPAAGFAGALVDERTHLGLTPLAGLCRAGPLGYLRSASLLAALLPCSLVAMLAATLAATVLQLRAPACCVDRRALLDAHLGCAAALLSAPLLCPLLVNALGARMAQLSAMAAAELAVAWCCALLLARLWPAPPLSARTAP